MSPDDRIVFLQCGLEGMSSAQTAAVVGANEETVRKRWLRLRERLAEHPIWREFDPAQP